MNTELRQSPRRRIQTAVVVVCDGGLARLPALVVDQSETGVRLRLADDKPIQLECYILFGHRIEPCRVVWQASRSAGLAFTG